MPSTFSTNLGIELITTGEQAGTWGATTNTNLGTLIEQAISGYVAQVITDGADTVITIPSGSTGVARNMTLELTGALSAARNLIVPSNRKLYFIYNNTTGGYAVTVKVSGQTGVSVPNGAKVLLVSNGTDVVNAVNYIPALYFSAGTAAAPSISTIGDTNTGIYFPAADNISLTTSGTQRVTLDSSGRLGLGTGSPVGKLQINDGSGRNVIVTTDATQLGTSGMAVGSFNDNASAYAPLTLLGSALHLATGGLERARVTANGNLLVGTTNDNAGKIRIAGVGQPLVFDSSGATTSQLVGPEWRASDNSLRAFIKDTTESPTGGEFRIATNIIDSYFTFATGNNTERMRLDAAGNLGIGTSSPGARVDVRLSSSADFVRLRGATSGNSNLVLQGDDGNGSAWWISTKAAGYLAIGGNGGTEPASGVLNIDGNGNVGLSQTPPPNTSYPGLFLQNSVSFIPYNGDGYLFYNAYSVGANQLRYRSSGLAATAYAFNQSGEHIWYNAPSGTAGTAVTFSERMRITSSGNLGIGTSSPGAKLQVTTTGVPIKTAGPGVGSVLSDVYITRSSSGTAIQTGPNVTFEDGTTNNSITIQNSQGNLTFWNYGAGVWNERARIDSSGNVGIGTSSPDTKLTVTVADTAVSTRFKAVTGAVRFRPYVDTTLGAIIDSSNAAESAYLPFTLIGSTLRLFGGGGTGATIDSSGNLGLGVTPSAWVSGAKAFQAGGYASFGQGRAGTSDLVASWNAIVTSGTSSGTGYVYRNTGDVASSYEQNGQHRWYTAPSGTAGNAITFTQAMTLDASGNLLVGTTSAAGFRFRAVSSGETVVLAESTGTAAYINISDSTSTNSPQVGSAGNSLVFRTGTVTGTERMRLDASGNLGLGVTPSAWGNGVSLQGESWSISRTSGFDSSAFATNARQTAYGNGAQNWVYRGSAAATNYEQYGGAHSWYTAPSGTAGNAISFTQAMTLDASGNLGLTQTRSYNTSANIALEIGGTDNGYVNNGATSSWRQYVAGDANGQALRFDGFVRGTGWTERARITSGGDLLVGTTTSSGLFTAEVSGAGSAIGFFQNTAATPTARGLTVSFSNATGTNTSSADVFQVRTAGAERATIRGNGGFANYQANDANLSDERLKTDIQPAASYLDKICAIPVKTFLYKDQTDTERNLGVIAQDVDAVAPELVDRTGFGDPPEGESPYLAIYQTDLQYALMKCIQEQQTIIEDLRARVAALESN